MSTKKNITFKNPIAFIDLAAQQKKLRAKIDAGIKNILDHGKYILGPEVSEFENKLAAYVGVKNCIGVASGTDALLMVLMARGIGPGDAVFTTPFTFIATAEVISLLGATPVFVDIDPRTYNLDPAKLESAIQAVENNDPTIYPLPRSSETKLNPKVIIPVDLFGQPADYDPIMKISQQHNLFVLEDAAQGLGGIYKGRQAGSLAHAAATSFFPAKPLGCYGDGGAILTDDDTLADIAHSIRVHGKGTDKYNNIRIGLNARLDTLQAAILLSKLEVFPHEIEERQRVAKRYTHGFSGCEELTTPHIPEDLQSVWAQYSLLAENREPLQAQLKEQGIPTAVYYGRPLHLQPVYGNLGYKHEDMPVSEKASQQVFSLPMHPYLPDDEIDRIVEAVLQAV